MKLNTLSILLVLGQTASLCTGSFTPTPSFTTQVLPLKSLAARQNMLPCVTVPPNEAILFTKYSPKANYPHAPVTGSTLVTFYDHNCVYIVW